MDVTSHSHVGSKREKLTIVKLVYQCMDCISLGDLTSPITNDVTRPQSRLALES